MPAPDLCLFDHERLEVYQFDIARGSALESAGGLDILAAKAKLTPDQIRPGKQRLQCNVRMLMGLIKRNSGREYDKGDTTK